ncbi:MAG: hypothetical protein NVSMB17_05790 [Candidatus Dormibacteria bacterium]
MAEGRAGLTLDISGRQVEVLDDGTGPGVLLLGEFEAGSDARWQAQVPALVEAGFRVVVPGLSVEEDQSLVDDVRNVLRTLGVPRVHVVGLGRGGELAWRFANAQAQKVDRVVLVSSGPPRSAPFTSLANPVLAVVGAEDPAMDEATVLSAQEHVSGPWQLERVEGAGAEVPSEQPARFNEILLAFLSPRSRNARPAVDVRAQVGRRLAPTLVTRLRKPDRRG